MVQSTLVVPMTPIAVRIPWATWTTKRKCVLKVKYTDWYWLTGSSTSIWLIEK